MADMVAKRLFEDLAKKDPDEIITAPFCNYNEEERYYAVTAWGVQYRVFPFAARIEVMPGYAEPHDYFNVFLINYLLRERKERSVGEWISVKDLAGGVTFFRGPHEIPTRYITNYCGDDLSLLRERCAELGGVPLEMADCSYSFEIIGAVKTALLYWQGDEDFPADANILLDKSIIDMPLDVVYALLCEVCMRVGSP